MSTPTEPAGRGKNAMPDPLMEPAGYEYEYDEILPRQPAGREAISDEKLAMIRLDRAEAYSLRNDTVFAIIARLDAAEAQLASASAVVEAAREVARINPHLRSVRALIDALATHDATAGAEGEGEG